MKCDEAVEKFANALPSPRREAFRAVLDLVRAHMPAGYEESLVYGMPSWSIPLSRYPDTYNKQPLTVLSLGAQKSHLALYLMGLYSDAHAAEWFHTEWKKSGKKLDMGKACLRFERPEDLALGVVAQSVARVSPDRFIECYEAARAQTAAGKKAAAKTAPKASAATKKPAAKKPAAKTK